MDVVIACGLLLTVVSSAAGGLDYLLDRDED